MKYKNWLWLPALAMLIGCSDGDDKNKEADPNVCTPRCAWGTKCVNGTCIEESKICDPECTEGFECIDNVCVDTSLLCPDGCSDNEQCVSGKCTPNIRVCSKSVCDDAGQCSKELVACQENEVCLNDSCTSQECDIYADSLCSKDQTLACIPTAEGSDIGRWTLCDANMGCQQGQCVDAGQFECKVSDGCVDDKTQCYEGRKQKCNSKYEKCENNECVIDPDASCQKPESCDDDERFLCTSAARPEKCPSKQRCQDGKCVAAVNEKAIKLWTVCHDDTDCAVGKCIRKLTLSPSDKGETNEVFLTLLSPEIQTGYGVCSEDCSQDESVCDSLDKMDGIPWTCQLLTEGTSPYEANNPGKLDANTLLEGTPFGAICRPPHQLKAGWSKSFCQYCDDTTPCSDGYRCDHNICEIPCNTNANCPMFFSCKPSDDGLTNTCQPDSGVCSACKDTDKDGYGVGHCENSGVDCDDSNELIFYSSDLPKVCSSNDMNCNGLTDSDELLGSDEHCEACDSGCIPTAQQCFAGHCEYVENYCEIGTCSKDGKSYCPEATLAQWSACADYETCSEGKCKLTIWKTCATTDECPEDLECLLSLTYLDQKMTFSEIDPRIPEGYGICTKDCTDDASVCGTNATCQLFREGNPLWDPQNTTYPITISDEALKAGTPFVSLCRPIPDSDKNQWSTEFCRECDKDNPCTDGYICDDGACLAPCNDDADCALLFTCRPTSNNKKVCKPRQGSCLACHDEDKDGAGVGHCPHIGYECNDTDPTAYYSEGLPTICEANVDRNCNGKLDDSELLHSKEHCSKCNDACGENKICIQTSNEYSCVFDPEGEFCNPGTCSEDNSKYCSTATTPAKWQECPSYYTCKVTKGVSSCVLDENLKCTPKQCTNNNHTGCIDNTPVDCDMTFEICSKGECIIDPNGKYASCKANSCFENVDNYICNASGTPEKCPDGTRCQKGTCITAVDKQAADMWTICSDDYQCQFGKCLKEVSVANSDETIELYKLDSRISKGKGVCTFDCTNDAGICDSMTNGDSLAYSCQIIYEGDSPWPKGKQAPIDDLDLEAMAAGVPYAAVCRPNPDREAGWSLSFCSECTTNSDCQNSYKCSDGRCLAPCENNSHCPVMFECSDNLCKPMNNGYCASCDDPDGDGSGIGHCATPGVDCDEDDPEVFYSPDIANYKNASACANTDVNCNGILDKNELIGTLYHCTACGTPCGNPETDPGNHIVNECKKVSDAYSCIRSCEEGFAFENGNDISSGCTKIITVQPANGIPEDIILTSGEFWAIDKDGDGYATQDKAYDIWCYKNVCYTYKYVGNERTWTIIERNTAVFDSLHYIQLKAEKTRKRDCNDDNAQINPSMEEVCDGVDNDCDGLIDVGKMNLTGNLKISVGNLTSNDLQYLGEECENELIVELDDVHHVTCTKRYDKNGELVSDSCTQKPCDENTNYSSKSNFLRCDPNTNEKTEEKLESDGSKTIYHSYDEHPIYKNETKSCSGKNAHYVCERVHHRSTEGDYYQHEVFCWAPDPKNLKGESIDEKYGDGIDNNCDGIIDDGFLKSCNNDSCEDTYDWNTVSELKATVAQKKEHCDPKLDLAGICGTGYLYVDDPQSPTCNLCHPHTAAIFDFAGDNTDTNCDAFEGDRARTLFVAVSDENYGEAVEKPTDARSASDIREFATTLDPLYHRPKLSLRPLASLQKAIEFARICMEGGPDHYNGAGCSRICYEEDSDHLSTEYIDAWYCDDNPTAGKPTYEQCKANPSCKAFTLPWDIVMTKGTFEETDVDFDMTYNQHLDLLNQANGFQHETVTEVQGFTRQNVMPGNAVWRIHGGAILSQENWTFGTTPTQLNIKYTHERFSSPKDISVFHYDGAEKTHFYMSAVAVRAYAASEVNDSMLYDGLSPATLIGFKALNIGRFVLTNKASFKLDAPNGMNAAALPAQNQAKLDGRDGANISGLPASSLFANDAFREWRRKHENAAIDPESDSLIVCPDGSFISGGGVGAVSPYSTAAYKQALDAIENRDAANEYCPVMDLKDWYIYNFGNMGGNNYMRKTGSDFDFTRKNTLANGAFQCAKDKQKYDDGHLNVYDQYVGFPGETCFGAPNSDSITEMTQYQLPGGAAGTAGEYDDKAMTLDIDGNNFNFRNIRRREELAGGNGGNGIGGAGAPAFILSNIDETSILHEHFGQQSAYELEEGPAFCNADSTKFSKAVARSIAMTYLAAIKFGTAAANNLADDKALIMRGAGGGTGGCGGLGGEAGYTGGSAIGLILSPDVHISVASNCEIVVNGGNGGDGANGQAGMAGGKGGNGQKFQTYSVTNPFTDNYTFAPMTLKSVNGQSGSGGGGGGAGASGKPGYAIGIVLDCSRYKTFEECGILVNESIRQFAKALIKTTAGTTKGSPDAATSGASAAAPSASAPVASAAGKAGQIKSKAEDLNEIINGKTADTEIVRSNEKIAYIYNENNQRMIGSNAQGTITP